jgi:hypothetical protein
MLLLGVPALAALSPARLGDVYPEDCTKVNKTAAPSWFTGCDTSPGGCFVIKAPEEDLYNVGNTSFGTASGTGAQYCIDHLQGYIYTKISDTAGVQYYEVDDLAPVSPAPQCRFLVGYEYIANKTVYHTRTYDTAGLNCTLVPATPSAGGVTNLTLVVKKL